MIYLTVAKYGLMALLGAVILYFVYARPEIDHLNSRYVDLVAEDAKKTADFLKQAAVKQKELQDAVDEAQRQALLDRLARDNATRTLNSVSAKLHDYIASATASLSVGLPQGTSGDASIASAKALGLLATNLDDFGKQCAAEADRLGDEVRRLEK